MPFPFRRLRVWRAAPLSFVGALFLSTGAKAAPDAAPAAGAAQAAVGPAAPDEVKPAPADDGAIAPHPGLYVGDARIAAPMHVVAVSGVSVTTTGASPTRPFASNVAHPGGAYDVGAEVGLVHRLSLEVRGATSGIGATGGERGPGVGMVAGLRVAIVDRATTHVTASAGYLREIDGDSGAWVRLAVAEDWGDARLAFTAHGEHVVARGRDAVDVMLMAGASYRFVGPLRGGVEYVAQDLEGALDHEEAERGVRHFVGPNLSLELDRRRLTITAGPAIGLSYDSPRLLARAALAYSF